MLNVLIVEDDPMARKLIEIYIKNSENYNHVQSLESAALAEFCCSTKKIDVILMDVCTAMNASGLDATEKIKKNFPSIKVIIMTSQPECSFIDRAREVGVDSFWYKSSNEEELMSVIERTMMGERVYPESTPSLKLGDTLSEEFSNHEIAVLRELVAGEPDAVIAEKLYISLRTVKGYVQSMREKTGFRNRTELAVRARESGLVINNK